jgi:apolipoprotein N-acyltransferase
LSASRGLGRVLVAAGAGVFFALAGPSSDVYPALWVGMVVLAYVVASPIAPRPGWRRAFDGGGLGLAFGVGANVVLARFVADVVVRFASLSFAAGVACLGLAAILQGLAWALAGIVQVQLTRRGVPSWVAFAIGVYAGTFVPIVFPWTAAGLLSPASSMIQLAELTGERGVTLLMALSAGLLAAAVRRWRDDAPRRLPSALLLVAGLAIPLLTLAEGRLRIARVERDREDAPTVTLGLVQPSIGALSRWDAARGPAILANLTTLTQVAEAQGAELTLWSEGAYPYPLLHDRRVAPEGARAVVGAGVRGPVLAGFMGLGPHGAQFNSAAVCTADGAIGPSYDKVRLLAFGEEIPLIGHIPWVKKTFSRGIGLVPGSRNVVQTWDRVRASVLICVEDVMPEAGRDAMADRPNLLVNLTNDAWFEGSRESELHLRLSALRSVESRRDMVRAVNFGPTSWIDAAGVVRSRYASAEAGVLIVRPALLEWGPTPYDRFGDWPVVVLLVLAAAASIARAQRVRVVDAWPPAPS